jgi:hypothetical protein
MKTTKIIFSTVFGIALLSLVSCSSTKSLPNDDVYYIPGSEPATTHVRHTAIAENNNHQNYSQGEIVSGSYNSNQDTTYQTDDEYYDGDYSARLKRFYGSGGSSLDYDDGYYYANDDDDGNYGYCSGNPDINVSFGFGVGAGYGWGIGFGWGYPYYGWGYPYYGWGYPHYGYPYYGGGYWDGYWNGYWDGYYGFYPNPYPYYPYYPSYPYYPDYGYSSVYRPRGSRTGGTNLPRYGSTGGSRASINSDDGYKTMIAGSGIEAQNSSQGNGMRVGSKEYVNRAVGYRNNRGENKTTVDNRPKQKIRTGTNEAISARNKTKVEPKPRSSTRKTYALNTRQKPSNSRSAVRQEPVKRKNTKNSVKPRYSKPSSYSRYSKERAMQRPKYSKPRQYQRLDTQQPRRSKEYYRPQSKQNTKQHAPAISRSGSIKGKTNGTNNKTRIEPKRRHNVYRPSTTKKRGISGGSGRPQVKPKPSTGKIKSYRSPGRSYSSPKSYSSPSRTHSTGSSRGGGFSSGFSSHSRSSSGSFSGGSSRSSSSSSPRGGRR